MTTVKTNISPSEWEVMRIVWTLQEAYSNQVIELLQKKKSWGDSTIKTLLGRLVKKNLLMTKKVQNKYLYQATVSEDQMTENAASDVFASICDMKKGSLVIDLAKQVPMSKADIQELQTVLNEKIKTAPETVACNCLPKN
ncbi:CopY/TcrY family copper transport repressor [Lactobacillus sp. YT155]|uniref:CopY/TcrY family copper transport repressor n=1 Tax=Lactobacillus sp. YT155 TaxID=3060955 RepID=UPI003466A1F7